MRNRVLTVALALIACAVALGAQTPPLRLQIAGGRVSMHAENVPVRTILAEWARLGGVQVINGDRIAGAPVTLELENVPERQALDLILRGVSGYLLAARAVGDPGASMFDRLMILPTSVAPRTPPVSAVAPVFPAAPGVIRPVPSRGPLPFAQEPDDSAAIADDDTDDVPLQAPVAVPRQLPPGIGTRDQNGAPLRPSPFTQGAPATVAPDSAPQPPAPVVISTPGNPFGLPPGASSRPGVIAPAPQQPQTQPRQGPED